MTRRTLLSLIAIAVLAIGPLFLLRGSDTEFSGADGQAADEVARIDPDHEPWFSPIWSPPGAETESLLFALQAALGAGLIGYIAGTIRTRHRLTAAPAPMSSETSPETAPEALAEQSPMTLGDD